MRKYFLCLVSAGQHCRTRRWRKYKVWQVSWCQDRRGAVTQVSRVTFTHEWLRGLRNLLCYQNLMLVNSCLHPPSFSAACQMSSGPRQEFDNLLNTNVLSKESFSFIFFSVPRARDTSFNSVLFWSSDLGLTHEFTDHDHDHVSWTHEAGSREIKELDAWFSD